MIKYFSIYYSSVLGTGKRLVFNNRANVIKIYNYILTNITTKTSLSSIHLKIRIKARNISEKYLVTDLDFVQVVSITNSVMIICYLCCSF